MSILVYGANGYTGRLVVKAAAEQQIPILIAGRKAAAIQSLAEKHGFSYRVFGLDDKNELRAALAEVKLVLNCAGPFPRTAPQLVEMCLDMGIHYLDITGEIAMFEWMKTLDSRAKSAGIVLLPGVGFDVVPTDCLAKKLHQALPDGDSLELAFMNLGGGISHGTLTTMLSNLGVGGAMRKNGKIMNTPLGFAGKTINFGKKQRFCISIPWGDISTAHFGTGIPNITVYSAAPKKFYYLLKLQSLMNPVFRSNWFRKWAQAKIDKNIDGPSPEQNQNGRSLVWGKLSTADGRFVEGRFEGPESYWLTALAALHIAQQVLKQTDCSGYQTPASCFGPDLVLDLPGTRFF